MRDDKAREVFDAEYLRIFPQGGDVSDHEEAVDSAVAAVVAWARNGGRMSASSRAPGTDTALSDEAVEAANKSLMFTRGWLEYNRADHALNAAWPFIVAQVRAEERAKTLREVEAFVRYGAGRIRTMSKEQACSDMADAIATHLNPEAE